MSGKNKNLFLVGPMGTGKTSVGRRLSKLLHKKFYDLDEAIEARCGVDIAWIFDVEGEEGFHKRESEVLRELAQESDMVLATGGGTIDKKENRDILSQCGIVIYLKTSIELQLKRTQRTARRPLLQVPDRYQKIIELMQYRGPLYDKIAEIVVDADQSHLDTVIKDIMKQLK